MSYKRPLQSSHPIAKLSTTPAPKSLTANVKSSLHANTSRTSTPSVTTAMMGMDSDSDDEKPLALRTNVSRANAQPKNGAVLTKANADVPRKGMGNVSKQSSVKGSDDSEDEKPLALRIAKCPAPVREDNAADLGDSDDDKPLVLKRSSNGVASNKTPVGKGDMSNAKKRPVDNKPKDEAPSKKLKLSKSLSEPSCISRVPKMEPSAPSNSNMKQSSKAPSQTPSSAMSKPSKTSSQSPSGTISKPSKTSLQSPLGSVSKLSKTEHSKPSSNIVPKTSSTIPSKASTAAKPSTPLPNALANTAVKMDIDEDEDDIPLAQRIPVVKTIKKPIVKPNVKPSTGSLSSLAAKKVIEARKAKFNQLQKKLTPKKKDGRSDKNAPVGGGEQKWTHLEHCGVIFPPPYKPHGIKMLYEGKPVTLTPEQEEVATMFAVMRDTDYAQKQTFLSNFWEDWKKILGPDHVIQNLEQCDFTPIYEWHLVEKEKKKQLSSEEKKRLKEEKLKQEEKYMWALVDGVKEKVGNFRVEPPGLFRGRGEHPKMGKLKRRIFPEDIVINIGKNVPIPECPIPGHRWKEIRHDNTVTWLAYWIDPINQREFKYVFLAASSSLKGQSDKEKYEKARTLKNYIENIRKTYTKNFTSSDMTKKQIAVATYLIDRLALRAGNEKDDDEADTVGCCSLKVEHVSLVPPKSLQFDFLGKDSIRYFNVVEVEEAVYKAVGEFKKSKKSGDDLFDKLDTSKLNAHLKNIMPQLTAKVFRTYNASITLDTLLVDTDGQTVPEKLAAYQWANKEVAILCNHQRSVSKSHGAQMEKLETKMTELEELLKELRTDLSRAKKGKPPLKDADGKPKRNQNPEALEKKIAQTEHKIEKMKLDMRIKDDLKTVALGTSKINYMDPRITVAWCKRHEVPIEKIFNKSLLAKFAWAMDVSMDYRF